MHSFIYKINQAELPLNKKLQYKYKKTIIIKCQNLFNSINFKFFYHIFHIFYQTI